ncbi:hypothetical protein ATB93_03020 [Sphingomonas sp. WG]|nr:hypothetical protein ATB93_03020 [Sphingomonas sp. WG]
MLAKDSNLKAEAGIANARAWAKLARAVIHIDRCRMPALGERQEQTIQQSQLPQIDGIVELRAIAKPAVFRDLFAASLFFAKDVGERRMVGFERLGHRHLAEQLRFAGPQIVQVFRHLLAGEWTRRRHRICLGDKLLETMVDLQPTDLTRASRLRLWRSGNRATSMDAIPVSLWRGDHAVLLQQLAQGDVAGAKFLREVAHGGRPCEGNKIFGQGKKIAVSGPV